MNNRLTLLLGAILLAVVALVYWPGLSGGFIFDDYPNIVTNSAVHAESLTWNSLRTAARAYEPGAYGRPLATVTFAIDYYLGGGKDAWQFKLTSLLVHLLNTLIVFWLVTRLLVLCRTDSARSNAIAAATVALLWAVHPLQVSSVLYVVQRMETLSLTFVLLALVAYLHGRTRQRDGLDGWVWIVTSGALTAIGMLSKETAALFPAFALALELTVLRFEAKSPRTTRVLKIAYAAGIAMALAVFVFVVLPSYVAPNAFSGRDFTLAERLLSQLRILPMYLGQMLLPLPSSLTFYYDAYPKSTGLLSPYTTLLGGMFIVMLLGLAWRLRQRMPLVSLGIFWFFASHLITSNVFNLELVFEHRNYFALLGVLLAVADLLHRMPMRDGPALKVVAVAAIVATFGFLGILRSATWGNPLQLASDLTARSPQSPRAASDLATLYVGMSDGNPDSPFYALGEAEFERASRLANSSPLPEQGLILMAATTGQPVKQIWWDRFIYKVRNRPTSPQELMAVVGLMKQRYLGIELDDTQLAIAFEELTRRHPRPELHVQLGDYALKYLGDEALANRQFVAAVDLSRNSSPEYPAKLAQALLSDGRVTQAVLVLQRMDELGLPHARPAD